MPGIGEIVGASIRENDLHRLQMVMTLRGMLDTSLFTNDQKSIVKNCIESFKSVIGGSAAPNSLADAAEYFVRYPTEPKAFCEKLKQMLNITDLSFGSKIDWYVQLRAQSSAPSGGFGLGIERMIALMTGTTGLNVRDCTAFPVHYGK